MKATSYRAPRSDGFAFTPENQAKAEGYIARYPEERRQSAVIWLLYLAQEQNGGSLNTPAIEHVAEVLDMAPIRVHEVASFYTMFNTKPVGKNLIQVCRTASCWLRGSDDISQALMEAAKTSRLGETSEDGMFTVVEVECLGACCNAPMVQLNDKDYFEDLTPEKAKSLVAELRAGKAPKSGSQEGRVTSEPISGRKTLLAAAGK
jgi:NADH-quinone oxidoreductase subunit E